MSRDSVETSATPDRERRTEAVDDSESVIVTIIAAVADNGVIGNDGQLPWHYPEDLSRFKETTMGSPVIMGRVTYEGIVDRLGEPLPGRTSVVLSSNPLDLPAGAVRVASVSGALATAREALAVEQSTVYVAGGESVYRQFLPHTDRMRLTEIHDAPEGDARFPAVDWTAWREIAREDHEEFSFVSYDRVNGS